MTTFLSRQPRLALLLIGWTAVAAPVVSAQDRSVQTPGRTLTLDAALQYAVDHYPTVRGALEQVNAAQAGVDLARSARLPRLDAVWQLNRATANNVYGQLLPQSIIPAISGPVLAASADNAWGSAVGGLLSWEPVDLGLRDATVREAEAGVRRAQSGEAVARLTVQHAVGVAYLGVVSAELAVTAATADVQRREVLARAAHVLVDNQLRPGAEASRADAEHAAARTRAIQAQQGLAVARTVLMRVLGLGDESIAVDGSRLFAALPALTAAPVTAAPHPLLRAAEASIDSARARESVLQRTDRPRLLLQSALFARGTGLNPDGRLDTGLDGLWPERANWGAGVQVVFPNLFNGPALKARQAAAQAGTRAEQARRDETALAVTAEQRAADAVVDASLAIVRNTPVQLAAATQSEAQARARYDAGLASIVEVAESQNLLAAAEFQDAAARVDVWRALLARAVASGDVNALIEQARQAGVQ